MMAGIGRVSPRLLTLLASVAVVGTGTLATSAGSGAAADQPVGVSGAEARQPMAGPSAAAGQPVGSPAESPDQADRLSVVTQFGGTTRAVTVVGDNTFVGVGPRVVVYATCYPARPVEVGRSLTLEGLVRDVMVVGPYLYAAIGDAGLVVLDVRDPSEPELVSELTLDGIAARLVKHQERLYVVAGYGGLHILDLAIPALPRLMGTFHEVVTDVAVPGSIAYVVARDLMVVDVSDPAAPIQVSVLNYWTDAIATDGRHLYAGVSSDIGGGKRRGEMEVYDITDPNPLRARLIARLDIGGQPRSMQYLDGEIILYGASRFLFIDVSAPAEPRVTRTFDSYEMVSNFAVAKPYLYLAAAGAGLRIDDLDHTPTPAEIAAVRPIALAHSIAAEDAVVYVEDEGHGSRVLVMDMSRPDRPRQLTEMALSVANEALLAQDGTLYVGSTDDVVRLYDVRKPEQPRLVSELKMPDAIWSLAAAGDYLYVANGDYLRIVDLRNPDRPYEIGSIRASGGATDIAVSQGFAYVTGPTTGIDMRRRSLQVIDVRDPFEPRELGVMTDAAGWKNGVAASGILAYIDGLQVVDVTDPSNPVEAARLSTNGETSDIVLSGQTVYAGKGLREGGGEVHVFDVADPFAPRQDAVLGVLEPVHDIAHWNGRLFVAAEEAGLFVLRDEANAPPLPTPTPPPSLQWPEHVFVPLALLGPIGPPCR